LNKDSIEVPLPGWERPGEGGKDKQNNLLCFFIRVSPYHPAFAKAIVWQESGGEGLRIP
jgi:hypothetical protein